MPASTSGGGGSDAAEAHNLYTRYLTGYTIPNGTSIQNNNFGNYRTISQPAGCRVTLPSGTIAFPEGEDTVTVPGHTWFDMAPGTSCIDNFGADRKDGSVNVSHRGKIVPQHPWTANASSATITLVPIEHPHGGVATGVTGTGFDCGRRYRWSDFAADAQFPMFLTAARRSLIGWVYVDATGQQIARCTAHRPIFRPAGQ